MKPVWNFFWITFFVVLYSVICFHAFPLDLAKVKMIESSGNPLAVSFRGARHGRGAYQISEVALQDYNAHNRTQIAPGELFNPVTAHRVAEGYLGILKGYLRHYGIPENEVTLIAAWNWGIGNTRRWWQAGGEFEKLPRETRGFITKYRGLE